MEKGAGEAKEIKRGAVSRNMAYSPLTVQEQNPYDLSIAAGLSPFISTIDKARGVLLAVMI